jgi:hypothetical protein
MRPPRQKVSPDQKAIDVGDKVRVRKDAGSLFDSVARSQPWFMGGHTWVILVDGISGCYALDRVTPGWPI